MVGQDDDVPVRPLRDLVEVERPALPALLAITSATGDRASVLPVEASQGEDVLWRLQVTVASALGALARHTGGVLIDHSWLRLLGGGGGGLPSVADANHLGTPTTESEPPAHLEVGRDVLGGRFAINGGAFQGDLGDTFYFAPDTLAWESMGLGHGDFVAWALSDRVSDFYSDLRWDGWEADAAAVPLDHGLAVYPPLFSTQSHIGTPGRSRVPWEELVAFNEDMAVQLSALPEGAEFQIRPTD